MSWLLKVLKSPVPVWAVIILSGIVFLSLIQLTSSYSDIYKRSEVMNQDMSTQIKNFNDKLKIELMGLYKEYTNINRRIDSARVANHEIFPVSSQDILRSVANGLNSNGYGETEFPTTLGTISCTSKIGKQNDQIAYIKFGANNSRQDESLIKAFISEATKFKLSNGYRLADSKNTAVDYGEMVLKTYVKDDLYFKTFFQYTRHSGTYNSVYFTYDYYIEVGSLSVNNSLRIESYIQKIGV
jgi:hypothetical protein